MPVSTLPLGMNARNFLYIHPYNTSASKRIADNKLATKQMLLQNGLPTSPLLAAFEKRNDVRKWTGGDLPKTFVVKPASGYGGEGILVIKDWDGVSGRDIAGVPYDLKELESHLFDILEGAYSRNSIPDSAFIEERIVPEKFFKKVLPLGLPDIRVIVFHGVPIMAMLRVPVKGSGGKANLHKGGIGVGIDLATGVTTNTFTTGGALRFFPDTKVKPHGLRIPQWERVLELAIRSADAVGLGYAGVDIVIDEKRGPSVLEVNARPGLSIQNANRASLRTRLERISGIGHPAPERGVSIARSLFAESFSEKIPEDKPVILGIIEPVSIRTKEGEYALETKVDTGAFRTSIDRVLALRLELPLSNEIVHVRSASGRGERPTVAVTFRLGGKLVSTTASLVDRSHMSYRMIIGRRDMQGFLVDPTKNIK